MSLIDTHCHYYLETFDADLEASVQRCVDNGISKIFLPAIDSETHDRLIALSEKKFNQPNFEILPTMGVHPCSIKTEDYEQELALALKHLDSGKKYYAVGEIGLDYYWDKTHIDLQVKAFETQIEWAIERNLPIIIHARESTADCIKSVRKYAGRVTGIFHCFSGNAEEAQQCIDLGFYLGVGGVVTYKKAGMKEMLPAIGIQNIVLETDAPYLTPVPHRGKRNEPSYVKIVAEHVADALQLTDAEVERITTANAHKVFQLG